MIPRTLRPSSALLLAALLAAGCASGADAVAAARRANDAALAAEPWPEDAVWIVAAAGTVEGAADLGGAAAVVPDALQRYVFRPGEQGDVRQVLAYHPGRGVVAGRAAARALGVAFRRSARGETLVVRDVRRIEAAADATIGVILSAPGDDRRFEVPVVVDPDFDGALLISPAVAAQLRLERFEIPGTADVSVALGRPFLGRRSRVVVAIPTLGVEAEVPAVVPR